MLRIKSITDKDGSERTDGKYPSRKGCIGEMYFLELSNVMIFEYIKDNQGNEKSGYLRSSIVKDYKLSEDENELIVYTMNSVYYFEKV